MRMRHEAAKLNITLEEYQKIAWANCPVVAEILKEIQSHVKKLLNMNLHDQECFILNIILTVNERTMENKISEEIINYIEDISERYENYDPHSNTTLSLIKRKFPRFDIPTDSFDIMVFVYKLAPLFYEDGFSKCIQLLPYRGDQVIIERLKHECDAWFISNPNIKSRYYQDHWSDFSHSKKLTLEFIMKDFESYISYFEEETENDLTTING